MTKDNIGADAELLNFLRRYCVSLSDMTHFSIKRMENEMNVNPRLKQPLLLYCALSGKEKYLHLEASKSECRKIIAAEDRWEDVSREYWKIAFAYNHDRTWKETQRRTKEKIRKNLIDSWPQGVSVSAIARQCDISPSALNRFIHKEENNVLSFTRLHRVMQVVTQQKDSNSLINRTEYKPSPN